MPGWPRILWGTLYETAVSFTLVRAMIDLLLPARLGFKVTPKGVVSDRRRFDLVSEDRTVPQLLLASRIRRLCSASPGCPHPKSEAHPLMSRTSGRS